MIKKFKKLLLLLLLLLLLVGSLLMCVGCYETPEKVNDQVQDAVKILEDSGLFN